MDVSSIIKSIGDNFARWVDIVRTKTRYAVLATVLFMAAMFMVVLATQGPLISRLFDYYAGSNERANAVALQAIVEQDKANDLAIQRMLRRLMRDLQAGRVVVSILVFNTATGEFSDLTESHEIMDRRAERTGLRSRALSRGDVQNTLDRMFPADGRVVCMTSEVDDLPDLELQMFLRTAQFSWTSACPIIDPDGVPMGLLAVSGRAELADRDSVTQRVRDSAFLLSGYLLRSPSAIAARKRLENQ